MGGGRARCAAAFATALVVTLGGCGSSGKHGPATLNWYVFNEPSGSFKAAVERCNSQSQGRYRIKIQALPTDADQQRELIVRRLAAKDSSVDIIGMDVDWTAEFAEARWIKPWNGE